MARTLTEFRLDEISGVDNPAQRKAKMVITKRDEVLAEAGRALFRANLAKALEQERPMTTTIQKARGDFMSKVAEYSHLPKSKAMEQAAIDHPELYKAYAEVPTRAEVTAGHRNGDNLRKALQPSDDLKKARADFNAKVAEIKKRDNLSTIRAMEKAATEHPELYQVYLTAPRN